jgi:vacuolar protein sorting-associated protein 35
VRQLTSILSTQIEAPTIALRLFLLSAQIADECGFEDLTYDLYVQAFSVYEDSISESRAQLQAITLIIGTLAGAKVFGVDNYDTLITKAALHGAKLLKKSHQATAVGLASHLWWQETQPLVDADGEANAADKEAKEVPPKEENGEGSTKAVCNSAHLRCAFVILFLSPVPISGQQACLRMPPKVITHCQLGNRRDRDCAALL